MVYLRYIIPFTIFNIYQLLAMYMSAYTYDIRTVDSVFCHDYVPINKRIFFCLCKKNKNKLIRKITRDREILSIICFIGSELLMAIFAIFLGLLGNNKTFIAITLSIIMISPFFIHMSLYLYVEKKCLKIARKYTKVLEVSEKNLSRSARNIMRKNYEGENRTYIIQKTQKKTFWYDYTEYHLYVDGQYLQTMVKQQKYRYSSIVETKWCI